MLQTQASAEFKYEKDDQTKPPFLVIELRVTPSSVTEQGNFATLLAFLMQNKPTVKLNNGVFTIGMQSKYWDETGEAE